MGVNGHVKLSSSTQTQIKVKEQLVVRKDMGVNGHVKLSSRTHRHKLK
jgi:ribosomal 30S subunit maturation factor RimM